MTYFKLALKLGPYIAITILIVAFLWQRGSLVKANAKEKAARVELGTALAANVQNEKTIEGFRQQRVDNDAIALAVAERLNVTRSGTERIAIELREARNDPKVRDWSDTPVPDSVQRSLSTAR